MRRKQRVLTATVFVAVMGGMGTAALAEMNINGPAELPPKSFTGRQYVDSAGCVFVRAGYSGAVKWVPRVSRNKVQLCGYKPTFQNGEKVLDVAKVAPEVAPAAPPAAAPAAAPAVKPVEVATAPAPAPAPRVAPKPAQVAAAPAPAAAPVRVARTPSSPFAPTPFVGRPMQTIASLPPAPAPAAVPMQAPVRVAAAPVAVPMAAPVAAPVATSRAGYVSPYVSGAVGAPVAPMTGGTGYAAAAPQSTSSGGFLAGLMPQRGVVRYHNTTPVPGPVPGMPGAASVTVVASETVDGAATSCPRGTVSAQRITLSDGRSVVRCGAATADPAAFINAAAVPGLVVAQAPAPMMGGTGYAASGIYTGYAGGYATAPMVGGTGYAVNYSTQGAVGAVAPMASTSQQAYAATSPYQSGASGQVVTGQVVARASASNYAAPAPVLVRTRSGLTTLAPIVAATDAGPSGYAPAFEDGRLNPYRGPRTVWGDAQQGMIWTNEVPAKAVTANTPARKRIVPMGAVAGYGVPGGYTGYGGYVSPYVSGAMSSSGLSAAPARVSSKSVVVASVAPGTAATPAPRGVAPAPQRVVASAPQQAAAPAAASGARYVQVGTFAVADNAARAKARLAAAGLPVASSTTSKGMVIVLAGPFPDARAALGTVRAAGFGDVILR